ncbi:MAG TPA: ATP-binding protein [Actinomycetes bacterium]|nr:ATP-binding protein [Actinomycetes bacterium]
MRDELRTLLRSWMQELTLDPLDPTDPRYVALDEAGRAAIDEIHATIDLELGTTTQLLSGPRGSGKTTELRRLKSALERDGFTVALVDILQFINQSMPVDVADFLVALALGVGEELPATDPARSFGNRLSDFLRRLNVNIKVGASAFGVSLDVDLKRDLKGSQVFVEELRQQLASRIPQLRDEIADFFQELVSQNRVKNPDTRGVVVIVDSLEKLRGTLENDAMVQASVEGLFVHHADKLRFGSHHMVYTVPTYLLFTAPGMLQYDGPVRPVPIPHLHNRNGDTDTDAQQTMSELVEVVEKRVPWKDMLGERELLHRVIHSSGGHLRDIFIILRQVITTAYGRGLTLPMSEDHVEDALNSVAHGFSSVTREQANFLRQVIATNGIPEPTDSEVQLMARLMDTHMLLGHKNGQDWYEVHPLARRVLNLQ